MLKLKLTILIVALALPMSISSVQAQVCDELVGQTPGLYGLCVAYCEAQEAPSELPADGDLSSLETPHRKILENYNRKMKEGDSKMPCVNYQSTCPAWTQEELNEIGAHGFPTLVDYEADPRYQDTESDRATRQAVGAGVNIVNDKFTAFYSHNTQEDSENNVFRNLEITGVEYEACKQGLINHVTAW